MKYPHSLSKLRKECSINSRDYFDQGVIKEAPFLVGDEKAQFFDVGRGIQEGEKLCSLMGVAGRREYTNGERMKKEQ